MADIEKLPQSFDGYAKDIFLAVTAACQLPESDAKVALVGSMADLIKMLTFPPMMVRGHGEDTLRSHRPGGGIKIDQ